MTCSTSRPNGTVPVWASRSGYQSDCSGPADRSERQLERDAARAPGSGDGRVGGGDLLERKACGKLALQLPRLQAVDDVARGLVLGRWREVVAAEQPDRYVLEQQPPERQPRPGRAPGAGGAGDEHRGAGHWSVREHRAMGGQARDAEAGALLEGDTLGQRDRLVARHDGVLGRGAEGAVGLRAVAPDALADARRRRAGADGVDLARAVAVGDYARVWHRRSQPALAFLDVAAVDAGRAHADANLGGAGSRVRELADLEHGVGRALPVVPGRLQGTGDLPAVGTC